MKFYQEYKNAFRILSKGRVVLDVFSKGIKTTALISTVAASALMGDVSTTALPTAPNIVQGNINIQTNTANMVINQSTNQGIINWGTFNIGSAASVRFNQPNASASTLNRVVGNEVSHIAGTLSATGKVILINPNGVIFGNGSRVDVGGIVASTMNLSNENYLNNTMRFTRDGATGTITNQGTIRAEDAGYIALLAPEVINDGVVIAQKGSAIFASGDAVTLSADNAGLLSVTVDAATVNTLIENRGLVQADGGVVYMSAKAASDAYSATISNRGTIQASSIVEKGGKIVLLGSDITNSGTLEAKGKTGGGEILIGGDWQGSNADIYHQAKNTTLSATSNINASSTESGNGGKIVVWSNLTNGTTKADGTIKAEAINGDGGQIETSGHTLNIGDSAKVSTKSIYGKSGQWLLDPENFIIASSGGNITGAAISAALASGDVTIQTASSSPYATCTGVTCGANSGDAYTGESYNIYVNDYITYGANTLTLRAYNKIKVNSVITVNGNGNIKFDYANVLSDGLVFARSDSAFIGKLNFNSTGSASTADRDGTSRVYYNKISDASQLAKYNYNYMLTQDIVLTDTWAPYVPEDAYDYSASYSKVFEGFGHTISGLNNSGTADYQGLFAKTNGATLRNVGIINSTITGGNNVGAFVGQARGSNNKFYNIFTAPSVTVQPAKNNAYYIGGIVGGFVDNAGTNSAYMDYVDNGANVHSASGSGFMLTAVGGLVGGAYNTVVTIAHASNTGTIIAGAEGTTDYSLLGETAGGLIGGMSVNSINMNFQASSPDGAINYGNVYGYTRVGGIIGSISGGQGIDMQNFVNFGNVYIYYGYAGGIYGTANTGTSTSTLILKNLANRGSVTTTRTDTTGAYNASKVGGIGGDTTAGAFTTIESVYNMGDITVAKADQSSKIGGLFGALNQNTSPNVTIKYAYNTGDITVSAQGADGAAKIGGIAGRLNTGSGPLNFEEVYTTGTYTNAGSAAGKAFVDDSYVNGGLTFNKAYSTISSAMGGTVNSTSGSSNTGVTQATLQSLVSTNFTTSIWSQDPNINSGLIYLGQNAPLTPVTITVNALSKTYGDINPSITYQANSYISSIVWGSAITQYSNAGTYSYSASNMFTPTFVTGSASAYKITWAMTNSLTINPYSITLGGTKIYDAAATTAGTTFTPNGTLNGDVVTVSGTANIASKNVGLQSISNPSNLVLSSSNYTVSSGSVTVNPKTVTLSASKTYDGSTSLTGNVTVDTGISGEALTYTGAVASDKNVATAGKYISAITLANGTDGDASNYQLPTLDAANVPVTINAKLASISGYKVYDGTASLSSVTITTGVTGETLTFSGATASSVHANSYLDISERTEYISAITLINGGGGGLASNYYVDTSARVIGNYATIQAATLTPTVSNTGVAKEYDGNLVSSITPTYTFGGLISGDSAATLTNTGINYNSKDVSTANTITVSGLAISGVTGSNGSLATDYVLGATSATVAGTITPKSVTVSAINVTDKVYDGTTNTTSVSAITLNGKVGGDTVNASGTLGNFSSKDVGTYSVSVTDITLSGTHASNYTLTGGTTATDSSVAITKKTITLNANKVYDGNSNIALSQIAINTGVSGETFDLGGSATLSNANVATASKYINVGSLTLTNGQGGAVASNYNLPTSAYNSTNNIATITTRAVTVSANDLTKVYGNANPTYTYTTNAQSGDVGLVTGQSLTGTLARTAGEDASTTPYVISQGTLTNANNTNYDITYTGAGLTITKRPITLTANAATAIYGNTEAALSASISSGSLGSATVSDTLAEVTGTLTKESGTNVGSYDIALGSGSKAGNYDITFATDNNAYTITRRAVTITAAAKSKTYGDNDPTLTYAIQSQGVNVGLMSGESLTGALSRAVGESVAGGPYAIGAGTFTNANNGNYDINYVGANLTINTRTVTLLGNTGVTKIYNGRTDMPLGNIGYGSIGNMISGDNLYISGTPVYNSKDVAAAATIQQGSVVLDGADAGNYTLSWTNGTGTITKAPLIVTANNDAKFVTHADIATYNSVSYGGLVNGEAAGSVVGGTLAIARTNSSENNAGTYSNVLAPSGLTAANYAITYANGDYTIVPAGELLVRVNNTASTYATNATYSIDSAQYMDNSNVIHTLAVPTVTNNSTTFSYADGVGGMAAFTLGAASPQLSTSGELKAGNYDITATNITESSANFSNNLVVVGALSVNQKAVTASATTVSKIYDGTNAMSNLTLGLSGVESGDSVNVTGNGTFSDKNVGTNKAYSVGSLALGSDDAGNYYISGGNSFTGSNGAITPKTVTLSALKTYDGNNGLIGKVTLGGFIGDETLGYSGSTANSAHVPDNSTNYITAITLMDGTNGGLASNYQLPTLNHTNAAVTINKKDLSIVAQKGDKIIGLEDPVFGYMASGFVNNETVSVLRGALSRVQGIAPGDYDITLGTLDSDNYRLFLTGAKFTIKSTFIAPRDPGIPAPPPPTGGLPLGNNPLSATASLPTQIPTNNGGGTNTGISSGSNGGTTGSGGGSNSGSTIGNNSGGSEQGSGTISSAVQEGNSGTNSNKIQNLSVESVSFDGILVGSTNTGNPVKAIVIQGSSISQTPVTLMVSAKSGEGFSFSLPQGTVNQVAQSITPNEASIKPAIAGASLSDGSPLPSWLNFNADTVSFMSTNVPSGGLPLTVNVAISHNGTVKTIEVVLKNGGGV